MSICEGCGTVINCARGCYMVCLDDCSSCSGGCEPAQSLPMRMAFPKGIDPLDVEISLCSKDLEPGTLTKVLGALTGTTLQSTQGAAVLDSGGSLQFKGTFRDLLAHAGLQAVDGSAR